MMTRLSLFLLLLAVVLSVKASAVADGKNENVRQDTTLPQTAQREVERRPLTDDAAWPLHADASCFAIHAYRVQREFAGSDAVFPAGQETCVPASRFKVRNALTPWIDPEPGK